MYNDALNQYRQTFLTDTKGTIQSRIDGSSETWTRIGICGIIALTNQFDSAW
jgi:hypothetical protein